MRNVIEARNLHKTYHIRKLFKKNTVIPALQGISFDVKEGEIFGILGPNGAGKSTCLNILSDLLTTDKGTVRIFGRDFFKEATSIKQHMSLINGYASAPNRLSIYQNLKIYAKIYNVKNAKERIIKLLSLVELEDKKDSKFIQLSSGQKTRVNIVKGLLHKPKLILMDEPTIGLDPVIARKIRNLIKDINKKENVTIVFTSHNMHEVEEVCDRVALLKEGKILKTATVKELTNLIDKKSFEIHFKAKKSIEKIISKYKVLNLSLNKTKVRFQTGRKFKLNKLITELVKNRVEIEHLHVERPTLEQVFIEVAEGRL